MLQEECAMTLGESLKHYGFGEIDLLGQHTEISIVDFESIGCENALGRWVEKQSRIAIANDLTNGMTELTLWHEVTHALLYGIGESELSKNEDFVEKLSRALHQTAELKCRAVAYTHRKNYKENMEEL